MIIDFYEARVLKIMSTDDSEEEPAGSCDPESEAAVGARVRALRELYGYSQRELARLAKITNGALSMIEQGQVSPSVGSLRKIANALSMTLGEFFNTTLQRPEGPFFRAAQLSELGSGGVSLRAVPAGVADAQLQVLHEIYPPGADTGPEPLAHTGEEAGVVVQGSITVTVGARSQRLEAGDAYYFESRIPHRFRNTGREPCTIISAATPRSF